MATRTYTDAAVPMLPPMTATRFPGELSLISLRIENIYRQVSRRSYAKSGETHILMTRVRKDDDREAPQRDRKSTRLNSNHWE